MVLSVPEPPEFRDAFDACVGHVPAISLDTLEITRPGERAQSYPLVRFLTQSARERDFYVARHYFLRRALRRCPARRAV